MNKHRNYTMAELQAQEQQENTVRDRAEAFLSGDPSDTLAHWDVEEPTIAELKVILRAMLERQALRDKLPKIL